MTTTSTQSTVFMPYIFECLNEVNCGLTGCFCFCVYFFFFPFYSLVSYSSEYSRLFFFSFFLSFFRSSLLIHWVFVVVCDVLYFFCCHSESVKQVHSHSSERAFLHFISTSLTLLVKEKQSLYYYYFFFVAFFIKLCLLVLKIHFFFLGRFSLCVKVYTNKTFFLFLYYL